MAMGGSGRAVGTFGIRHKIAMGCVRRGMGGSRKGKREEGGREGRRGGGKRRDTFGRGAGVEEGDCFCVANFNMALKAAGQGQTSAGIGQVQVWLHWRRADLGFCFIVMLFRSCLPAHSELMLTIYISCIFLIPSDLY